MPACDHAEDLGAIESGRVSTYSEPLRQISELAARCGSPWLVAVCRPPRCSPCCSPPRCSSRCSLAGPGPEPVASARCPASLAARPGPVEPSSSPPLASSLPFSPSPPIAPSASSSPPHTRPPPRLSPPPHPARPLLPLPLPPPPPPPLSTLAPAPRAIAASLGCPTCPSPLAPVVPLYRQGRPAASAAVAPPRSSAPAEQLAVWRVPAYTGSALHNNVYVFPQLCTVSL